MAISKEQLEDYVTDLFSDFLYYDRKEDDEFTVDDAESLSNICTKEELIAMFVENIDENFK